jgi:hypothetical protein
MMGKEKPTENDGAKPIQCNEQKFLQRDKK